MWKLSGIFSGDRGITQTVYAIRRVVRYAIRRPEVRTRAEWIVANCPERDVSCEIRSIYNWISGHYRFLGDIRGIETVKSPELLDVEVERQGFFQGDCDDVTGYVAALLTSIGHRVRLAVIYPPGAKKFRHIYPEAYIPKLRRWIAMELTARQHPLGWEAPRDYKRVFYI